MTGSCLPDRNILCGGIAKPSGRPTCPRQTWPLRALAYTKDCAFHATAAPGVPRSSVGLGLNPIPPLLSEGGPVWSAAQTFVFIKSGVKLPACRVRPVVPGFGFVENHGAGEKNAFVSAGRYRDLAQAAVAEVSMRDDKGVGPVMQVVLGPVNGAMAARGGVLFKRKCSVCHAFSSRYRALLSAASSVSAPLSMS